MSEPTPSAGTQAWLDLTVDDATTLRTFYEQLLGWTPHGVAMSDSDGAYEDWAMLVDGKPVGGICHRRGPNTGVPPMWMPYFLVADVQATVDTARQQGAEVIDLREKMAILRDPAGACFGVYQQGG